MRTVRVALLLWLAAGAPAQEQKPPQQGGEPPKQGEQGGAVDEARKAADLMRRLLGLKPGPQSEEEKRAQEKTEGQGQEPGKEQGQGQEKPQGQQQGQQGPGQRPPVKPLDEAEAAERLLRRLLPDARRPEQPPIPTPAGPPLPPPQDQPRRDPAFDEVQQISRTIRRQLDPTAHVPSQPLPDAPGFPVHGRLSTRYRGRHGGGETDQDLVALLSVDFGDAQRNPVTGRFLGRGYADLDGDENTSRLRGIEDTFGHDVTGRVYEAWADVHAVPGLAMARVGRQPIDEAPVLFDLDGVRVESPHMGPADAWVGAYGGVPVFHFDGSRTGDRALGVAGGVTLAPSLRVRADYLDLRERRDGVVRRDRLLGVSGWWVPTAGVDLHAHHDWLDGDPRRVRLRGGWTVPDVGTRLRATWTELLTTQREQVTVTDPLFAAAFDQLPYRQVGATVEHDLTETLTVNAGFDVRRLRRARDERAFNREFERWSLGGSLRRLLDGKLTLSVVGDHWDAGGERISTVGGDARLAWSDRVDIVLGSSYHLYRFDELSGIERDHVRLYSLRLDLRPRDSLRVDLRAQLEDSELDDFFTFRAGMTWTF